jgi:hypothetical protein
MQKELFVTMLRLCLIRRPFSSCVFILQIVIAISLGAGIFFHYTQIPEHNCGTSLQK